MNKYLILILIVVVLAVINGYALKNILSANGFVVKYFLSHFKNIKNIFLLAKEPELKEKRNKYLLIGILTVILDIAFIACVSLLLYSKPSQDNTLDDARCIAFKKFENEEYNVVIVDKYCDMHRSLCPTLVLQDKKGNKTVTQEFSIDRSEFFGYVQIGDTLVKLKNDNKIRVKNSGVDASVTIDFGCPEYKTTANQDNKTIANRDSLIRK
jgi:hypothetical protein